MTIEEYILNSPIDLKLDERLELVSHLVRLVNEVESSLSEPKKTEADRKRNERIRDELGIELEGRPTNKTIQLLMQIIEYLCFFDGRKLTRNNKTYLSKPKAIGFVEELCFELGWKSRNHDEPDYLKRSLRKAYKEYVPGTLEGLPKGHRYNSAFGGPKIVKSR